MHLTTTPRLFAFMTCVFSMNMQAQSIGNYSVTRTTGITYSSILASGTACGSWRNNGTFIEDDNRSNPVDIGFDFWYDGTRYTSLSISTNGYIDFSSSTADGGPTTGPYGYDDRQFTRANGTLLALAPFYDDLTTQGATDPLGNSIRYQLSGTAPNRVFTIEWTNMAVYANTTPNLNFQVKLHETTGVIDFVYGSMVQGTNTFSHCKGINAATLNNVPTVAQLKDQQVANTTTFSNAPQYSLSQLPVSNSQITFTPPVPLNPAGVLTFTAVQQTQMTLNWTNWATNEVGYVIYNSTDGINYDFITQTAANATNATITGLYAGTTYYWKVYAVTEGALSNSLNGTRATLGAGIFTSVTSGSWNTASTWSANAVPGPNNDVVIANGHTVTVNTNASCHNLTVGQGGASILQVGNNNSSRTLSIGGTITVNANAVFRANANSNTTHTLTIEGNILNNGTLDFQPDNNSFCDVTFDHPYNNQSVSGTGPTTRFNNITVDKGSSTSKILDITSSVFTAPAGFLTLVNGTFRISDAVNITPFNATSDIPYHAELCINNAGAVVNTTSGNINLFGEILLTNGTLNIGSVADNSIVSNGGTLVINGGTMNIAGRLDKLNTTTLTTFAMTGGTLNVPTVSSTSNTSWPVMMDVPGSQFRMSGGLIVIKRKGGTGNSNFGFNLTGAGINSVTGGTLQVGDATTPAAQIMKVSTVSPVGNFVVASANATAQLITDPLFVIKNIQLQSGVFLANNLDVTLGGNWSNTGGIYTAGTNTTTFISSSAQTIQRTAGAENFNHILFTGAGKKSLLSAMNCNNITISGDTLDAGTSGFTISAKGTWTNNGIFLAGNSGLVLCNGTTAQTIGGTAVTQFRDLTILNTAGVSLAANEKIRGTLTLASGTFTTTGYNFTLLSDITGTARIATITTGNITGNIIMQRYIYNGPTAWRQMCGPVTGTTLQDWNNELITSGFPGSDYPNMTFYSIATYNETVPGVKENGYVPPTNVTNPLVPNKGYFVYVGPLPVTVDVKGPPVKMNQTFSLTYTPSAGPTQDGWNLLGNPYPSTIDWDAAGWTRTGTDNVLYIWNPALNQYATYVSGVGTNGGTKYIPSSQAFWVRAIAASPSITINESCKSAVDQSYMRLNNTQVQSQQNLSQLLSLTLKRNSLTDQVIVRFDPAATDSFDVNYDAYKLGSMDTTMPFISSLDAAADEYSINTLSPVVANTTVPLRVRTGVSGMYTITRDSISQLPHSMCVTLEDLFTGTLTPLPENSSYTFFLSDTTHVPRFLLHFGPSLSTGTISVTCPGAQNGAAFAKGTGNGPWDYTWKDASGNFIAAHTNISGTDTLFNLAPGNYVVEVSGNDGYCSFRSDTITVSEPDPITAYSSVTPATCTYSANGEIQLNGFTGGTPPYNFVWQNNSTADSLVHLSPGTYWLHITDGNSCTDSASFVVSSISHLDALFTVSNDTADVLSPVTFSNYTAGGNSFEWDFGDGSPLNTDGSPVYTYSNSGNYLVTLVASDSLCSDTASMVVVIASPSGIVQDENSSAVHFTSSQHSIGVIFHLAAPENAVIRVYDASGKLVANEQHNAGMNRVDIPVNIAVGVYSIEVIFKDRTVSGKVIVSH